MRGGAGGGGGGGDGAPSEVRGHGGSSAADRGSRDGSDRSRGPQVTGQTAHEGRRSQVGPVTAAAGFRDRDSPETDVAHEAAAAKAAPTGRCGRGVTREASGTPSHRRADTPTDRGT